MIVGHLFIGMGWPRSMYVWHFTGWTWLRGSLENCSSHTASELFGLKNVGALQFHHSSKSYKNIGLI